MEKEEFLSLLESKTLPLLPSSEKKDDAKTIWETAFNFAISNQDVFSAAHPLLIEYSKTEKSFNKNNEAFNDYISKFDENKNIEENLKFLKPVLLMMPFMNADSIIQFLKIVSKYVQELAEMPLNLLSQLEKVEYSLIPAKELESVDKFLRTTLTEESRGLIFSCSPIVGEICECVDKAGDFYVQLILRSIRSGVKEQQISAFVLLKNIRNYLSFEDTKVPEDLFTSILPFFVSEDNDLFNLSHKVMVKLLKCGVFVDHLKVKELIKQYSKYKTDERLIQFFKFIEKLLVDTESVTIPVAQPIYAFLGLVCKRTPPLTRALCLEAYSLLAVVKKDVFEEVYEQELEVAQELLDSKDALILSKVSCFVSTLSNSMPETFARILKEFIPKLVDFLFTKEESRSERKYRLDIAQTVSEAVAGGLYNDVSARIIDYIYTVLDDPKGGEIYYIGSVVITLRQQLNDEQCTKLFQMISKYMEQAEQQDEVNISIQMMKKLISKKQVDVKIVKEVVDKIMAGNIKILHNLPPYRVCESKSMLMLLVTSFIKKYKEQALETAKEIIQWLPKTRVSLLPTFLEPLREAIEIDLLDDESSKEVYATIIKLISIVTADNELSSIISCLIQIISKKPAVCDGEEVLRAATEALAHCHAAEANEEDDDDGEEGLALSALSTLVLTVYSIPEIKAEVNKELICNVLDEIDQSAISEPFSLIVSLLKQGERFKAIYVQLCKPVVSVLFLKKDELADAGIEQKDADEAKSVVKGIFKKNKIVEKQVQKDYSTPRQKLNRFNTLFK